MELFALLVLSVGGVSAALFARFYYGMTVTSAYYYLIQKTPLGQMIHDTKCSKHAEHVHAQSSLHDCGTFIVRTVAFLEDSYCHLIVDKDTGRMAAVDPGDAKRVLSHVGALQAAWDAVHRSSREAADSKVELVDDEDVDSAGSKSDVTIPAGPPPPAAAAALLSAVRSRPELSTVLITHNHPEAAGGNRALREALPDVRIVAPAREAVVGATAVATHGAKLFLGRTEIDALATPAHTAGGMCYYLHGPAAAAPGRGRRHTAAAGAVSAEAGSGDGSADAATPTASAFAASASVATSEDDGQEWASGMAVGRTFAAANGALFTGDTLLVGSAGAFLECSAEEAHAAFYGALRAVPPATPVFPGREGAVDGLQLSLWLETRHGSGKGNAAVDASLRWALRARGCGRPALPTSLAEERAHNPYLRLGEPALRAAISDAVQAGVGREMPELHALAALRRLHDGRAHADFSFASLASSTGAGAGAASSSSSSASASAASSSKAMFTGTAGSSSSSSSGGPMFTGTRSSSSSSNSGAPAASSSASPDHASGSEGTFGRGGGSYGEDGTFADSRHDDAAAAAAARIARAVEQPLDV